MLNISSSYLSRIIKRTNESLAPYQVRVENLHKRLRLVGEEIPVRLFIFYLLSESYSLVEWPFDAIEKDDILGHLSTGRQYSQIDYLSIVKQNLLCIIIALTKVRISNNFLLPSFTDADRDFLKLMFYDESLTKIFHDNFKTKTGAGSGAEELEMLVCNMLVRVLVPGYSTRENRLELGRAFLDKSYASTSFAKALTQELIEGLKLKVKQHQFFLFEFYITVMHFMQHMKGDANDISELFGKDVIDDAVVDEVLLNKIDSAYEKTADAFNQEYLYKNRSTRRIFTKFLYELVHLSIIPRIYVYLQITGDYVGETFIYEHIRSIFNPNTVVITTDYARADLIITNIHNNPRSDDKPVFYFNSIYDYQQWSSLVDLIWKMIIDEASKHDFPEDK